MIFHDEDEKQKFIKSNYLLHVVCAMIEFEAGKFEAQIELAGTEDDGALIFIPELKFLNIVDICSKVNKMFVRKDKKDTCWPIDQSLPYCRVLVTTKNDLESMQ